MEGDNVAPGRRMLLRRAAGIAAAAGLGLSVRQALAVPVAPLPTSGGRSRTPGKPGDFDWLSGEWRIRHRRLKSPGTTCPLNKLVAPPKMLLDTASAFEAALISAAPEAPHITPLIHWLDTEEEALNPLRVLPAARHRSNA